MQDIKTTNKKETKLKNKKFDSKINSFTAPIEINSSLAEKNKPPNKLIGKKLTGDAELISWLSGREMNNKNIKDDEGYDENNSKIKKKLRNKLIKNAKKCELYFIHKYPDEECICVQCIYCLKKKFNHNELIRFINFDEFAHYLKYIFYLSDKVICYSPNNFKSNKKNFDILFSKFKKKEEKWDFNQEKIICKLCMFKLINKPDFIQKIKKIFLRGENEKSYNINEGDIIIELNLDENKNNNNKSNFVVEKMKNNDINKSHKIHENKKRQINNNNFNYNQKYSFINPNINNYNNPNCFNIYNSNNININIRNNNKIINNFYPNNNSILEFCEKIKNNNNEIKDINPTQINYYWKDLFCFNHNRIIDLCVDIKNEIFRLMCFIKNINLLNKDINENNNNNNNIGNMGIMGNIGNSYYQNEFIIQKSKERTIFLFKEITNSIIININYLNVFSNDLKNCNIKNKNILNDLIIENKNNFININNIVAMYTSIVNFYMNILNKK